MAVYACGGLALFLFVLLFFVGSGGSQSDEDFYGSSNGSQPGNLCPPEIVDRIFSRQDREFIKEANSPRLRRIYFKERRQVARAWIHQTSWEIRKIMRAHLRAARASQNLELSSEFSLLLRYVELRCICGLLYSSTLVMSPGFLQELARYASAVSHRIMSIHARLDFDVEASSQASGTNL